MKPTNRSLKVFAVPALILIAGLSAWWFFLRGPGAPEGVIALSGRIESDDAAVAAKTQGRIREITVREGDAVIAGQVIAVLDDDQIKAREQQEQSSVEQAETRMLQALQEISVLGAQLEQSRLSVTQAQADAQGRVSEAQAQVAAAEASLAQALATYQQALYDKDGVVATRAAEPGEVIAAGTPIVTLVNFNEVYLKTPTLAVNVLNKSSA